MKKYNLFNISLVEYCVLRTRYIISTYTHVLIHTDIVILHVNSLAVVPSAVYILCKASLD